MERVISFCGLWVMIGLAWLMSSNRRRIQLRVIFSGLFLQVVFAVLVLKTSPGRAVFEWFNQFFHLLLGFVRVGSEFVFGKEVLNTFPGLFAFHVLPSIIFFSALMSLLYHFGVMQRIVQVMSAVMQRTMGTSGAESLSTAANIFVGQTEAPLVVRPYLAAMTQSELMAVMVGGFATVAGGVMAAYVQMGIDAGHLATASVIAAPATLLIAKVMQPEVDQPQTLGRSAVQVEATSVNALEAITIGAADGLKLALNVAAMLIAFLALLAFLKYLITSAGGLFGQTWSLDAMLGYAFAPLAWLMGVESKDCFRVGELLGLRMAANEFLAYERLSQWAQPDSAVELSERSRVLATYALCGFANFGSIGVQIGGIGPLAPERQGDLARLGLRAMLGGTLACFMTACIAGMLL